MLIHFNTGDLIIHLGMSGSLRIFHSPIPSASKHDHVDIIFEDGTALRYHDPRRFGAILWNDLNQQHTLLSQLGPEPLSDDFNGDYLYDCLKTQKRPIKTALMDNSVVVGVGNIYTNESLFHAKVRPTRPANRLTKKECVRLVECVKDVLEKSIALGGSTLKDFVDSDGKSGYFQQTYFVYGRDGQPCKICQTPIQKTTIGQRGTFFCKKCQR